MKNHVVSLELAKKMKALNFPQESEFYYCVSVVNGFTNYDLHQINPKANAYSDYISAYLASELTEFIGTKILCYVFLLEEPNFDEYIWRAQTRSHECECPKCKAQLKKYPEYLSINWEVCTGKTLIECMANLCIELAEKGIINPKEL